MSDPVEEFLSRLQHPVMAGIDLSLDRMLRLLALLGNPQKRLPPVIHVAGTNGKGSLLAYLHSIFETAGLRVHRYTSPHLVHFNERILLRGQPIEQGYLMNILKHVAPFLQTQPVTFFEATTTAAFIAFAEKPADVLLLETGMGGRLDSTNVLEKPALTAITPISLDHMNYLGNSIAAIAKEKAGIIKRGVPCVVGRQGEEALAILKQKAKQLAAPLYRMGVDWQVEQTGKGFFYHSTKRDIELKPSLAGDFQYDNAATAVACLDQLPQFAVSDAQIAQGLAKTVWPARLQHLKTGRLRALLPPGIELWLDGGHNAQGGEVLAQFLRRFDGQEIYFVCGMIGEKDSAAFLKPFASIATALYAIAIPNDPQSKRPEQIEMAARGIGMEAHSSAGIENALQAIARRAKTPSVICICGSLYLAGKMLAANGEN